jgi:hypothetical protein
MPVHQPQIALGAAYKGSLGAQLPPSAQPLSCLPGLPAAVPAGPQHSSAAHTEPLLALTLP